MCNRQDTFLVSHGIIPECLLHSNRQLNSIPQLSGQIRLFPADIHQTRFITHLNRRIHNWATLLASVNTGTVRLPICRHVHKPSFSTLIARTRFASTSVVQPHRSHHPRVSHSCRRASRSFQIQPIVDLFHLQTRCSSLSPCLVCKHLNICKMLFFRLLHHSTSCSPKHSQQPF